MTPHPQLTYRLLDCLLTARQHPHRFGTYTSADSVNAGLDLEMPGPPRVRGKQTLIAHSVRKVSDETIDERVRKVLGLVNAVDPLNIPENAPEKSIDSPETSAALRRVARDAIVLMKNDGAVLPFKKDRSLAVIGPNAKIAAYAGGGSANLRPYYAVTPYDGIRAQKADVEYALGAEGYRSLPVLSHLTKTKTDGKQGLVAKFFTEPPTEAGRQAVDEVRVEASDILLSDYKHPAITSDTFWMDLEGTLTVQDGGEYVFGVSVCGTARLFVGGVLVVDNTENQRQGDTFFGSGTVEEKGTMRLEPGKTYDVYLQFGSSTTSNMKTPGATVMAGGGVRVGGTKVTEPQDEIDRAVRLAKEVDQVVIIAGLNVSLLPPHPPTPRLTPPSAHRATGNPKATTAATWPSRATPTPSSPPSPPPTHAAPPSSCSPAPPST